MRQRTQNPPPLKACRFDSDLGHHLNFSDLSRRTELCAHRRSRRIGFSRHPERLSQAKDTYTFVTHKCAAADPETALIRSSNSELDGS